jgi:tetratricopeptide (TPR) repeat protein
MSAQMVNSLLINPSDSNSKTSALYQYLVGGIETYRDLGRRIIRQIKAAHAFRQTKKVRELSGILITSPVKEYQFAAQYYLAWCDCRELKFDTAALERIVEQTQTYKTQALFSRGAIDWYLGNNEQAMCFYLEALKTKPQLSEYVDLMRTIAVLKSQEGFHASALRDMEKLIPTLKHVEPRLYFDFLNSYAVELGEAGRVEEARNVSNICLASPFAPSYPEWYETADDLAVRGFKQSQSKHKAVELENRIEPGKLLGFKYSLIRRKSLFIQGPGTISYITEKIMARNSTNKKHQDEIDRNENLASLDNRHEIQEWAGDLQDTTPEEVQYIVEEIRKLKERKTQQKQS